LTAALKEGGRKIATVARAAVGEANAEVKASVRQEADVEEGSQMQASVVEINGDDLVNKDEFYRR